MKKKKKLTQRKKEPDKWDPLLGIKVVKWDPLSRMKVVMLRVQIIEN